MSKFLKKWWWTFLLIPVVLVGGFLVWALTPLGPMPEAMAALESDEAVIVGTEPWLIFQSTDTPSNLGLIVYPGGRVDYRSYAPTARAIAQDGHLVVIPRMTLNLAVFSPDKAGEIIAAYPEIQTWVISGHSLGGSMAASYARKDPENIQGLILWASYPASSDDLSNSPMNVSSIYGTHDGVATVEEVLASRPLLPGDTAWVPIEGGNHAQFGWYGDQPGDNPAAISHEDQQAQIVKASLELLTALAPLQ